MREKNKFSNSSILSSGSAFLIGMGSVFNLWGDHYISRYSKSRLETDEEAMAADWRAIGKDLYDAIDAERNDG